MKNFILLFASVGLIAITMAFASVSTGPSPSKASKQITTNAIPDDIKAVFEKSCMGCHSDDAKGFAKMKVNFSKWDSYDPKTQASKGAAICKMLQKGKMPPKSVRKSKPELIPSQDQVTAICNWAQTLGK
jgi:cytochrome c5